MQKKKIAPSLFLRPKPAEMLVELRGGPKYATIIAKKVDCTYSHTVKLLDVFQSLGLVEFEKKGRIKIIKLTPIGEELARALDSVFRKLSKVKTAEKTSEKK